MQEGELNAENEKESFLVLQHQGLIAVEIKEINPSLFVKFTEWLKAFQVGQKWTALFFRQLSTTLDVMNLKDSLELFLQSTKGKTQQQIIKSMLTEIELGKTLAEAMENHKTIFSNNIIQMMVIAQRSGKMQEISEKLAEQLDKSYKSRKKLQSVLYYPSFVFLMAIISLIIVTNVVLPAFSGFFESSKMTLPILTQVFLTVMLFLSENFLWILIGLVILLLICTWIYKNSPSVQFFLHKYLLKVPFLGRLILQREWMNAFGSLAFLLESGIQIDEAIQMIAMSTSNRYLRSIWLDVKYEVERGGQIKNPIFPMEYQGLISTGEASGTLPEMLKRCETMSEFEVDEISAQIPVKAEIATTLIVGLIVAMIVFSVVLPILSIDVG